MPPSAVAQHPLDEISLGLIVQIRERLLKAQAAGKKVYRLESGDPNFSVPPHVLEAVNKAGAAGKTHYIPNSGIPELRKALAEKVVRKNGDVSYVFLDPDHFLEIRIITQRSEQGAQVEVETDLGDYEKIGGVFFPFSIEAGSKGASDKQKIIFEKAEVNVPVDEAVFKFPAPASK